MKGRWKPDPRAHGARGSAEGSTGLPTGGRRLGSGIHRSSNGSVGQTVLVARSESARQAHGSRRAATGRQNPALVSCSLSRQRSASRREKLAVSGRGGVETPVRWRHTVLPWQHVTRCGAHGCSSLKMWVASVGRTRLGHFRKRIERLRGDGLTRAEPRRLRRRRRGASRVNRRAKTVHLAWTTGRADRAAK